MLFKGWNRKILNEYTIDAKYSRPQSTGNFAFDIYY